MGYTCYKPPGSCATCSHFRYDEDKMRKCCFAEYDKKNSGKSPVPEIKSGLSRWMVSRNIPAKPEESITSTTPDKFTVHGVDALYVQTTAMNSRLSKKGNNYGYSC